MDQKNLADLYGLPPIPWSRALDALETKVPEAMTLFYDFSAPSAGPPPWYLYEVKPTTVFGVLSAENESGGATRWRLDH